MKKPIAIIGTPGKIAGGWDRTTGDLFSSTGFNTGNLAFQYGASRVIADEKEYIRFDFSPSELADRYRLICIPAANYLYSDFDFADFANRLEDTNLPLLVLGLGMQASKDISEINLKRGTQRLLRLFAERAARIFVRGKHTAAFLDGQGVHNFSVLGCPSNFINFNPQLGRIISRRLQSWDADGTSIDFAPTFYPQNTDLELALLDTIGERLREIICQEPIESIGLARGRKSDYLYHWLATESGFVTRLGKAKREAIARRFRAYSDIEAWLEGYRQADLVIGTRIHGSILGWQAARPAIVVAHDLRTAELAEATGLALVTAAEMQEHKGLTILHDRVLRAAGTYDARRKALAREYVELLKAHDVDPVPELCSLAAAGERITSGAHVSSSMQPTRAAPGFLERYSRSGIAGWVPAPNGEAQPLLVKINGVAISDVSAGISRPEHDGLAKGFLVPMPAELKEERAVTVEVMLADGRHIGNSPALANLAAEDPGKVLCGKHGTLFFRDGPSRSIAQISGALSLDPAALSRWEAALESLDALGESSRCPVFFLVIPSKECVYADRLPDGIALSEDRPVRQLQAISSRRQFRNLRLIYPLEVMSSANAPKRFAMFPDGDTHPTQYGLSLIFDEVWRHIEPKGPGGWPLMADEAFEIRYGPSDLLALKGDGNIEGRPELTRPFRYKGTALPSTGNLQERRVLQSTLVQATERMIFYHDWLGRGLKSLLAERFAELQTGFATDIDMEAIDDFCPDVVLIEKGERFLMTPPALL
jgi:hypothetical protein